MIERNKHKKLWFLYDIMEVFILLTFCNSCSSTMTIGHFDLNGTLSPGNGIDQNRKIERLESGSEVPEGYSLIISGEFKTGVITVKCGESFMVDEAFQVCRKSGGDAFRLFDIKEPDLLNTCYRSKILILKKRK